MDAINKELYERKDIAAIYAYNNKSGLQPPEEMIFQKYSGNIYNKRILDIGCGTGRTTFILKDLSKEYTGIDYSAEMIAYCENIFKCGENVRFIPCDVRNMRIFGDGQFDFVLVSYNGLDYIDHEGRRIALSEIHRVLREDGMFVFSSHNLNYVNLYTYPKMKFTLKRREQRINIRNFLISVKNRIKYRKLQYFAKEYSIVNTLAHNYGALSYCIDKKNQISQLGRVGFEVIEMRDICGNILNFDSEDSKHAWIYYVARKISLKATTEENHIQKV
jgi:ubiquinone/menaquinone biosynthesis C-methylase UbiE